MPHNQSAISEAFLGWGATAWVHNGYRYFCVAGEACVRFSTNDGNTGSPPSGFDYGWFDWNNYAGEVEPDQQQGTPDPEAQMSVTTAGWIWWGPRNRYYDKFRDGIGKSPTMLCGDVNPEDYPMFAYDPADGSSELVMLPGDAP